MRVCVRERIAQCADEGVTEGPHIFTLKAPKITSLKDKLHNSRLRKEKTYSDCFEEETMSNNYWPVWGGNTHSWQKNNTHSREGTSNLLLHAKLQPGTQLGSQKELTSGRHPVWPALVDRKDDEIQRLGSTTWLITVIKRTISRTW